MSSTSHLGRKFSKRALAAARQAPKSAWAWYVQEKIGSTDQSLTFADKVRELGSQWKNLSTEQKAPYRSKYEESKQNFISHKKNLSDEDRAQIKFWRKTRRDNQIESGATRTPSAYAKFVQANKEAFSTYDGDKKGKLAAVSKQLSEKWKSMTPEQKAVYQHSGSV